MLGPFPIEAVIALGKTVPGVKIVGGASELSEAEESPPRNTPALFALREERGGKILPVTGKPMQQVGVLIKLVMWIRHAGSAEQAEASMTAFEREVRRVFFGWRPDPGFEPCVIQASGADQKYGSAVIRQLLLTSGYRQTTEATTP